MWVKVKAEDLENALKTVMWSNFPGWWRRPDWYDRLLKALNQAKEEKEEK